MLLLFGRFSPFCRRAPCLVLEDAVEMGAAGKSAFGRNDIVAVVGILLHHLLGCIETDLAEPYSEIGMQTLVKNRLSSFFEMQSVWESVSIFTLQSL